MLVGTLWTLSVILWAKLYQVSDLIRNITGLEALVGVGMEALLGWGAGVGGVILWAVKGARVRIVMGEGERKGLRRGRIRSLLQCLARWLGVNIRWLGVMVSKLGNRIRMRKLGKRIRMRKLGKRLSRKMRLRERSQMRLRGRSQMSPSRDISPASLAFSIQKES